jgi:hypothetical protein
VLHISPKSITVHYKRAMNWTALVLVQSHKFMYPPHYTDCV